MRSSDTATRRGASTACSTSELGVTGSYVAGDDYSIADIACFPWVMTHKAQGFDLDEFVHVRRWYAELRARPRLQKGLAVGRGAMRKTLDDEARKILFGSAGQSLDAVKGEQLEKSR